MKRRFSGERGLKTGFDDFGLRWEELELQAGGFPAIYWSS